MSFLSHAAKFNGRRRGCNRVWSGWLVLCKCTERIGLSKDKKKKENSFSCFSTPISRKQVNHSFLSQIKKKKKKTICFITFSLEQFFSLVTLWRDVGLLLRQDIVFMAVANVHFHSLQVKKKRPGRDGKMAGLVPVLYVNQSWITDCTSKFGPLLLFCTALFHGCLVLRSHGAARILEVSASSFLSVQIH